MNKAFQKALGDIKKQKKREEVPEKEKSVEEEVDLSSSEERRLVKMGALKKKIHKEDHKADKWKHDKFKSVK